MITNFKHLLSFLTLSCCLILHSCREFYDEEFLEDDLSQNEAALNSNYQTNLVSTDPTLTELSGNSTVRTQNGVVQVDVSLKGIPQNINQIHYGFSNSDCSALSTTIALDGSGGTRSFNISESLTAEGLDADLESAGAASPTSDLNLDGKTFLVKAFAGANVVNLACGQLSVTDVINDGNVTGGTAGGTVGGTVGGTTSGTFGGDNSGTFGGDTSGTFGGDNTGTLGGAIGGSIGGTEDGTFGGIDSGTEF